MIGQLKMNERLTDMTPDGLLLDVNINCQRKKCKKKKKRYNKHQILIRSVMTIIILILIGKGTKQI